MSLRSLAVGLVSGVVYFPWVRDFVKSKWSGFDVLSVSHWQRIYEHYEKGWRPATEDQQIFIAVILGFIPVFLIGWFVLCSVLGKALGKKKPKIAETDTAVQPEVSVPQEEGLSNVIGHRPPALAVRKTAENKKGLASVVPAHLIPSSKPLSKEEKQEKELENLAKSDEMEDIILKAFMNTAPQTSEALGIQMPTVETDMNQLHNPEMAEQNKESMKRDLASFNQAASEAGYAGNGDDLDMEELINAVSQEPDPVKRETAAKGLRMMITYFEEQRQQQENAVDARLAELAAAAGASA